MSQRKAKVSKKKSTKKRKVIKKKSAKKLAKSTKKKATQKKAGAKKTARKAAVKKKSKTNKKVAKKTNQTEKTARKTKVSTKKKTGENSTYKPLVSLGETIPKFMVPSTGGSINSEEFGNKKVVLFFYPKDATPGCTQEGHDFTRLRDDFEKENTVIYGVSRDSIKSHEKFKEKQNYTVDLLSDEGEDLCKIFGVIKLKNMYGKKVRGVDRSTFIINEKKQLIREWRGVKVPGHADEVLKFIKQV